MLTVDVVDAFSRLIEDAKHIVLITHINPDADTLGSACAMYDYLWRQQKKVSLFNATQEIATNLRQLDYVDKLRDTLPQKIDLLISFDAGSMDRLGLASIDYPLINIDHHISNEGYGTLNIIEPDMASTTQVVFTLMQQANMKVSAIAAQLLMIGLISDTLSFGTDRVTTKVFDSASALVRLGANVEKARALLYEHNSLAKVRLASFMLETLELIADGTIAVVYADSEMFNKSGAMRSDSEEALRMVMSLAVVQTAVMLREEIDGRVKVSLRTKSDMNMSLFAARFGGGGHKKASGFEYDGALLALKTEIIDQLKREINAT